ncbi:serine protease [Lithospermum erythrorhizon]|uniref:Serine protease n=1 Tax=Lithospermum erythrorhizon TaxID=34254 RepID=A0AAV3NGW3_LITER
MAIPAFFNYFSIIVTFSTISLFSVPFQVHGSDDNFLLTYIVHTDSNARPFHFATQDHWYSFMIESLVDGDIESFPHPQRIFYTYDTVFEGFAARLTRFEANRFEGYPGVVDVREASRKLKLDTTHSAGFLGLNKEYGLWAESRFGEDVIIGIVDTGIWPESKSFDDRGLGPIPARWKGSCQDGTLFNSSLNCNRKLIGAKFFLHEEEEFIQSQVQVYFYQSPRDGDGHGSHTASTAAGAKVHGANIFGFADGTARGVAPKARIAMYKACSASNCEDTDILAAIESAVKDGVDVLSISVGGADMAYYENVIAIGTFAAMKRNIFVSSSAGNAGPTAYSVHNTAPWLTTVGAGSMDRTFPVEVHLGNNMSLVGSSLYGGEISDNNVPLLFLGNCSVLPYPRDVIGKIAVCNSSNFVAVRKSFGVQKAGGYGFIQLNFAPNGEMRAFPYILPSATLGYADSLKLLSYIKSTKNPIASFKRSRLTVVGENRAPVVLPFSARGPNIIVPEILKPDVIAPGLDILAAWPSNIPPTRLSDDPRRALFNTDSGTSMSCPHVAGLAALLRSMHPDWSPAAIRSALMTTATTVDDQYRSLAQYEDMSPAIPFSVGAGHVHPQLAADPGLVYDAGVSDYINFLCSLNYTEKQMRVFTSGSNNCSGANFKSPGDLNYPSFSVVFNSTKVQEFRRTLTHVGTQLPEVYKLKVDNPNAGKLNVTVMPEKLLFDESSKTQDYTVKFQSNVEVNTVTSMAENAAFGSISWESDLHVVRSPFAIMWNK